MSNVLRGEVEFTEAGEGIVLRCLPSALVELASKFGKTAAYDVDAGASEFARVVSRVERLDAEVVIEAAKLFAKKGSKKDFDAKINVDTIDMTFADLKMKVLDAIHLGVYGKTYAEHIDDLVKNFAQMQAEARGEERPQEGLSG